VLPHIVIVALLLLVPLHGLASVARDVCEHMSGTNKSASTHAAVSHVHAADGHLHTGVSGHQHADADTVLSSESPEDSESGRCAHCAACFVGAALIDSVAQRSAAKPTEVAYPASTAAAPSRPFDGPERPPRTI
jgi:hypothetical protein